MTSFFKFFIYDFLSKVLATFGACAVWDLQTELLQFPLSWHFGPDCSFFFFFYDRFHRFFKIFILKTIYLFIWLLRVLAVVCGVLTVSCIAVDGFSCCSMQCGILVPQPDIRPMTLHCKADSHPLGHQGSP